MIEAWGVSYTHPQCIAVGLHAVPLAIQSRLPPLLPPCRIVLENSGVAEPQNIRDKFGEAAAAGHPLLERIELDALVTLVDSATFIKDYASRWVLKGPQGQNIGRT